MKTKLIPQIGDEVRAKGHLVKEYFKDEKIRTWVAKNYERPVKGIYIGKRTLYYGTIDWNRDSNQYFKPTGAFPAYLVVTHPRKKPIYVYEHDLEFWEGDEWVTITSYNQGDQ